MIARAQGFDGCRKFIAKRVAPWRPFPLPPSRYHDGAMKRRKLIDTVTISKALTLPICLPACQKVSSSEQELALEAFVADDAICRKIKSVTVRVMMTEKTMIGEP